MGNKHRGETDVFLNGKQYTLRPSFEALAELESITKVAIYDMLRGLNEGRGITLTAMRAGFYVGIKYATTPGSKHPSLMDIGDWIQADGIPSHMAKFLEFITRGVSSSADLEAEEQGKMGKGHTSEVAQAPLTTG